MRDGRVERRLAAIIAADVVGYSRLMGADEEGTLRRLQGHRRELIHPKLAEHHGRMVKTAGDGMIIEFASVVDAMRCAVEVQRCMVERERAVDEPERIQFRVGLNVGDIIIDRDDVFGDGVNVAARLEALAEPGGICISGITHGQVCDKLPYTFADLGEQSVKNIAQPVRVFAMGAAAVVETPLMPVRPLSRAAGSQAKLIALVWLAALIPIVAAGWWVMSGWHNLLGDASDTKPAPRLSIVVLPLANLSNDSEQDHFVDAITDDLTTDLSRISGSFVIARTTAFTYRGRP